MQHSETEPLISGELQKERISTSLLAHITASISCVLFGFGVISTKKLNSDVTLGILCLVFSFVGSIIAGVSIDKIGRKKTIFLISFFYISGYILALLEKWNELKAPIRPALLEFFMYVATILCCIGMGMTSYAVPVYNAEISSTHLRGLMGATTHHMMVFGLLFRAILECYLEYLYVYLIGVSLVFVGFLIAFMPESPRWLLAHNQRDKAFQNLLWLRGTITSAEDECNDIETSLAHWEAASVNDYRPPGLFLPLFIGSLLCFIHQVVYLDYRTILYTYLAHVGSETVLQLFFMLQTLLAIFGSFIVHWFRRRILLLSGSILLFLYSATISIFFSVKHSYHGDKILLTTVIVYTLLLTLTWGPLPWIIVSEIFPQRARGFLGGVVRSSWWLFLLMQLYYGDFKILNTSTGGCKELSALWFSSCLYLLSLPFVYFIVPETKGKTLEEIEHYYLIYRGFRNFLF